MIVEQVFYLIPFYGITRIFTYEASLFPSSAQILGIINMPNACTRDIIISLFI